MYGRKENENVRSALLLLAYYLTPRILFRPDPEIVASCREWVTNVPGDQLFKSLGSQESKFG